MSKTARPEDCERLPSVHPGEILREEFMQPLGPTVDRMASDLGVPARRVSKILDGHGAITADIALRLARYFNTSGRLWMNLQSQYDLEVLEHQDAEALRAIPTHEGISTAPNP